MVFQFVSVHWTESKRRRSCFWIVCVASPAWWNFELCVRSWTVVCGSVGEHVQGLRMVSIYRCTPMFSSSGLRGHWQTCTDDARGRYSDSVLQFVNSFPQIGEILPVSKILFHKQSCHWPVINEPNLLQDAPSDVSFKVSFTFPVFAIFWSFYFSDVLPLLSNSK